MYSMLWQMHVMLDSEYDLLKPGANQGIVKINLPKPPPLPYAYAAPPSTEDECPSEGSPFEYPVDWPDWDIA
jgi:hypothetical protein